MSTVIWASRHVSRPEWDLRVHIELAVGAYTPTPGDGLEGRTDTGVSAVRLIPIGSACHHVQQDPARGAPERPPDGGEGQPEGILGPSHGHRGHRTGMCGRSQHEPGVVHRTPQPAADVYRWASAPTSILAPIVSTQTK